jgi:hypothetical protein
LTAKGIILFSRLNTCGLSILRSSNFGIKKMHHNEINQGNVEKVIDFSQYKNGLIFDADGVNLFGKYQDEMSAWRAKKEWIDVLHDYFLLEPERDYEINVISNLSNMTFCLKSNFTSACGRYAFWRLINHQAPEAEKKLGGTIGSKVNVKVKKDSNTGDENWIINPITEASNSNKESAQILKKILRIFQ